MSHAEDTSPGRRQRSDTRITHQTAQGQSATGADVLVLFIQDGMAYGPETNTVNTPIPRACSTRRIAVHSATAGVNVAGNWNIELYKNASLVPVATFTFNPTTLSDKFSGLWSAEVNFEAGDTLWMAAQGPSRNIILLRVNIELEIY